jgi:hypothetical protein
MKDDVSINSNMLLLTDFINLKIKSTQSFRDAHKKSIYSYIHKDECSYIYISIYIYNVFLKKLKQLNEAKITPGEGSKAIFALCDAFRLAYSSSA